QMCRAASKQLLVGLVALQALRPEKVVAGNIQGSIDVAGYDADIEIIGQIRSEPRRESLVVVGVALHPPTGRHQIGRGYRDVARVIMSKVEIVVEPFQRPAYPGVLVEGAERAAFEAAGKLRRPRPFLGDDVDDAADRIGTVEPALRAAHH